MQKFKFQKKMNFLVITLFALALSACVKPKTKSLDQIEAEGGGADAESSAFYITEIKGVVANPVTKSVWQIPTTSSFSFSTCVKDTRTQDAIRYAKFAIIGAKDDTHLRTDGDGCLSWTESIDFNFLASAQYIGLNRSLRSEGLVSGSRKIKVAIYPWDYLAAASGGAVVDLSRHPNQIKAEQMAWGDEASAQLQGRSKAGQQIGRYMLVDDLNILAQDLGTAAAGKDLALTLSFKSKVSLPSVDTSKILYSFKGGKVKVSVAILSITPQVEDGKIVSKRNLLARAEAKEVTVADSTGKFNVALPVHVSSLTTSGQIEVVLKVEPVDGPENLKSFEGAFTTDNFGDVSSSTQRAATLKNGFYKEEKNQFSFDNYIGQSSTLTKAQLGSGQDELSPYIFSQVSPTRDNISRADAETATVKTINYNVPVCITTSDRKILAATNFTVINSDGKNLGKLKTNDGGCIILAEKIKYNVYDSETYLKRDITFISESGFTKHIQLRLNPWDDGLNFARDARYVSADLEKSVNQNPGVPSKIYFTKFLLEQIRTQYEVDKYFQLKTHRTVRITFSPMVERYSSLSQSMMKTESLRNGRYVLKYALRTEPHGAAFPETIETGRAILHVRNGIAQQAIDLPIQDIRLGNVRSQFYMEMSALNEVKAAQLSDQEIVQRFANIDEVIDKNSGLASRTFVGPIQPNVPVAENSVRPVDDLAQSFCGRVDCDAMSSLQLGKPQAVATMPWPTDLHLAYANVSQLQVRANALLLARSQQNERMLDPRQFGSLMNASVIQLPTENGTKLMRGLGTNVEGIRKILGGQVDGKSIDALCGLWAEQIIPQAAPKGKSAYNLLEGPANIHRVCDEYYRPKFAINILKAIDKRSLELNNPFLIERKLKALEMNYRPDAATSVPLDLTVMTSFASTYSDTVSYGWTMSGGASAGANLSLPLNGGSGGDSFGQSSEQGMPSHGLSSSGGGPKAGLGAGANIGLNVSRTGTSAQSTATTYSVSAGKTLSVDQIQIPLVLTRYQRCALVGMNPKFTKGNLALGAALMGLTAEEKNHILTRKILICDVEERKPLAIQESYYVVAQGNSGVTDQGNLSNLPFTASLRGSADFAKFMTLTQGSLSPRDVKKDQSGATKSYERLNQSYLDLSASYPGFYTMP